MINSFPPISSGRTWRHSRVLTAAALFLATLCETTQPCVADDTNYSPAALEEVIVTAQKRAENLQDVPVPVTAIAAESLVQGNQLRLQDYYTSVPGFTVAPTPSAGGAQLLAIRGVTTGSGTIPTVGIMVDDVPYGSSTFPGMVPDIDPGDLARVEVLRGPQGTLYGASSMGGLLKFVTVDPSTESWSARVQSDVSGVRNGTGAGYGVRGSVNIPVNDSLAVRASAFSRTDPGYIDNPVLGISGINKANAYGGRLAASWNPADDIVLKLSALYQDLRGDGANDVDIETGLSGLQQNYLPGIGSYDRKIQAYSANLTAKLGGVELTAVSGYNINHYSDSIDFSYAMLSITQPEFGVTGTPLLDDFRTRKFTQEIRALVPIGTQLEWLIGGFYTHEDSPNMQTTLAENATTGAVVSEPDVLSFPTQYSEYAAFTDLTVHWGDRFDLQVGARESQIRESGSEYEHGPYVPFFDLVPSPWSLPEFHNSANAFTYLVTPRFSLTPDIMVYGRLASGYRPGGINTSPDVPLRFNPDKTENFELGAKAGFLDRRLSVDVSAYYIDWKNVQISLLNPQYYGYNANAGKAKSEGLELQLEARPTPGLVISASSALGKAILTDSFPANTAAIGNSGDPLPYSTRFSGQLSAEQSFVITSQVSAFLGGSVSYVGDRQGEFSSSIPRQDLPAYARTDVRVGARYRSWTASLFATNLTDRRGLIGGGQGTYPPFAFSYIRPRAIGVLLTGTF